MFSFFKKKISDEVDLSGIHTDMHSHLLPGIDDGSPDCDTSLKLIQGLLNLGYKQLITTPHIMADIYPNDPETIQNAHNELKALQLTQPVRAAAEYFIDDYFDRLLIHNVPLLTIKDNWVLVEFSFVGAPVNLKEKLFELQIKGYQPILAHPERYIYFLTNKKWYDELKDIGCFFQLNILSLTNYYGKVTSELARYLIKKNYINLLGTDLHHARHLQVLQTSPHIMGPVKALLDSGQLLNGSIQ